MRAKSDGIIAVTKAFEQAKAKAVVAKLNSLKQDLPAFLKVVEGHQELKLVANVVMHVLTQVVLQLRSFHHYYKFLG